MLLSAGATLEIVRPAHGAEPAGQVAAVEERFAAPAEGVAAFVAEPTVGGFCDQAALAAVVEVVDGLGVSRLKLADDPLEHIEEVAGSVATALRAGAEMGHHVDVLRRWAGGSTSGASIVEVAAVTGASSAGHAVHVVRPGAVPAVVLTIGQRRQAWMRLISASRAAACWLIVA